MVSVVSTPRGKIGVIDGEYVIRPYTIKKILDEEYLVEKNIICDIPKCCGLDNYNIILYNRSFFIGMNLNFVEINRNLELNEYNGNYYITPGAYVKFEEKIFSVDEMLYCVNGNIFNLLDVKKNFLPITICYQCRRENASMGYGIITKINDKYFFTWYAEKEDKTFFGPLILINNYC